MAKIQKEKILVKVLSSGKLGEVVGVQHDFWGEKFFIIKIKGIIYAHRGEDFRYTKTVRH